MQRPNTRPSTRSQPKFPHLGSRLRVPCLSPKGPQQHNASHPPADASCQGATDMAPGLQATEKNNASGHRHVHSASGHRQEKKASGHHHENSVSGHSHKNSASGHQTGRRQHRTDAVSAAVAVVGGTRAQHTAKRVTNAENQTILPDAAKLKW